MTTSTLTLHVESKSASGSRIFGAAAMIASPMLFISGLFYGFEEIPRNRVTATLGLIFVLGWGCSAIGLRFLRVAGSGAAAKTLFFIQMTLLSLAASQQIQDLVFDDPEANGLSYFVADIAWPLSMLLMLIMGIFILKAGVWHGWRRVSVLICGLSLPVLIIASAASGNRAISGCLFGIITTIGFMLLGYAIFTGRSARPVRAMK